MADCPCSAPEKIDLGCALEIAKIVTAGELSAKKWEVAKHVLCLAASAVNQFDGEPAPLFAGASVPATLEDCCKELETRLTAYTGDPANLDPGTIAIILQLLKFFGIDIWSILDLF